MSRPCVTLVVTAVALLLAAPRAALACPVCFGQSDSPLAVATNMGIIVMLGRRRRRARRLRVVLRLPDPARRTARRGRRSRRDRRRRPNRRRGPLNAELPRAAGPGIDARRRDRSDDGARALADAGACSSAGARSSSSCCSGSARARTRRRATRARRARSPRAPRSRSRSSRSSCSSFYAIPGLGDARQAVPVRDEAVVVRVVAEQFAWNIHYPGRRRPVRPDRHQAGVAPTTRSASIAPIPTAKDDITTINQLNLPVDRPVLVHLSSKDVIHSFGLYRDAREAGRGPGHGRSRCGSSRTASGEYEIACSQLCGLGHFRMRGFITIQTRRITTSGSPTSSGN